MLDVKNTDVYTGAAHAGHIQPGNLLVKREYRNIDYKKLVDENMVHCIVPLHVITGCDPESGFYGKCKSKLFETVRKDREHKHNFSTVEKLRNWKRSVYRSFWRLPEKLFMVMSIVGL